MGGKVGAQHFIPSQHLIYMQETPVVLVTYNRPTHTAQVLSALKAAQVKNLFVYSDAPKRPEDVSLVAETRRLISAIDWTTPEVLFRGKNLGLGRSILGAVNQVLEVYEQVIVLEDDCVPGPQFFPYMEACLKRYASEPRVFGVSGYGMPLAESVRAGYPHDVYFYPRIGSWGWGTWRRAWKLHDTSLASVFQCCNDLGIDMFQGGTDIVTMALTYLKGGLQDTWTLPWAFSALKNNAVFVYPTVSHVQNIGLDGTGVHCVSTTAYDTPVATTPPTKFPEGIRVHWPIYQAFRTLRDDCEGADIPRSYAGLLRRTDGEVLSSDASARAPQPKITPVERLDHAVKLASQGQDAEALPILRELSTVLTEQPVVFYARALVEARLGLNNEARASLRSLFAAIPNHGAGLNLQRQLDSSPQG